MKKVYWTVIIMLRGTVLYMRQDFKQEHEALEMYEAVKNTPNARVACYKHVETTEMEMLPKPM